MSMWKSESSSIKLKSYQRTASSAERRPYVYFSKNHMQPVSIRRFRMADHWETCNDTALAGSFLPISDAFHNKYVTGA